MTRLLFATLITVSLCSAASAQVYKTVNKDGSVTYSDSPQNDDSKPVELEPLNTQPAIAPQNQSKITPSQKQPLEESLQIQIVDPRDGATVPPGQRDLLVSVGLSDPLPNGYLIQVLLDGKPASPPSQETDVAIGNLVRGEHTISAVLVDSNRKVAIQSKPVTVFVQRASIAN